MSRICRQMRVSIRTCTPELAIPRGDLISLNEQSLHRPGLPAGRFRHAIERS